MDIDLQQSTYSVMVSCNYIFSSYLTRIASIFCTVGLCIKNHTTSSVISKLGKRIIFMDFSL